MKIEVGEMPCRNEHCESHKRNRPVVLFLNDETAGIMGKCDKCGEHVYGKFGEKNRQDLIRNYCQGNEAVILAAEQRVTGKKGAAAQEPEHDPQPPAKPAARQIGFRS